MSMTEQNQEDDMKSCEGCLFLRVLYGSWFWDDCITGERINGILVIDRIANARAEWGDCGPERKNYMPKQE